MKTKRRPYNTLPRRLHAILVEGGARKYGILEAVARSWGYELADFHRAIELLIERRMVKVLRRYGGIHYEASAMSAKR